MPFPVDLGAPSLAVRAIPLILAPVNVSLPVVVGQVFLSGNPLKISAVAKAAKNERTILVVSFILTIGGWVMSFIGCDGLGERRRRRRGIYAFWKVDTYSKLYIESQFKSCFSCLLAIYRVPNDNLERSNIEIYMIQTLKARNNLPPSSNLRMLIFSSGNVVDMSSLSYKLRSIKADSYFKPPFPK